MALFIFIKNNLNIKRTLIIPKKNKLMLFYKQLLTSYKNSPNNDCLGCFF
ncbi:hypothetical protein RV00_GL000213 [Enterococcus devriesei]|uniref:Uncharacterized protein n=1 Tax=Enterococcus devriesei TaxID=319970 RepID=A0A1L8SZ19_9ENTE|nr:hypothetical protein RV00_GL000213 [Enterococcus devriesei]